MDVDHEIQLLKEEIKRLGTPGLYGGCWFLQLQILFSVWRCLLALCKPLLFKLFLHFISPKVLTFGEIKCIIPSAVLENAKELLR